MVELLHPVKVSFQIWISFYIVEISIWTNEVIDVACC